MSGFDRSVVRIFVLNGMLLSTRLLWNPAILAYNLEHISEFTGGGIVVRINNNLIFVVILLLAAASDGTGHHSFAAEYNRDDPVEFDGVVTRVEWKNPHAHFYVDVTTADGTVENWDMELASPNMLVRNGWKRDLLKQDMQIHVTGSRANDGTNTAATTLITLPNGNQLTFISNPNAER